MEGNRGPVSSREDDYRRSSRPNRAAPPRSDSPPPYRANDDEQGARKRRRVPDGENNGNPTNKRARVNSSGPRARETPTAVTPAAAADARERGHGGTNHHTSQQRTSGIFRAPQTPVPPSPSARSSHAAFPHFQHSRHPVPPPVSASARSVTHTESFDGNSDDEMESHEESEVNDFDSSRCMPEEHRTTNPEQEEDYDQDEYHSQHGYQNNRQHPSPMPPSASRRSQTSHARASQAGYARGHSETTSTGPANPLPSVFDDNGHPHFSTPTECASWMNGVAEHVKRRAEIAEKMVGMAETGIRVTRADIAAVDNLRKQLELAEANPDYDAQGLLTLRLQYELASQAVPVMAPSMPAGLRRIKKVIQPAATEEDLDDTLENDDELLRWVPRVFPNDLRAQLLLGAPPDGRDTCFACVAGGQDTSFLDMENITRTWEEQSAYVREEDLAITIEKYYERCIREPANALLKATEFAQQLQEAGLQDTAPLGPWSAASILEHFQKHMREPKSYMRRLMHQLSTMREEIYSNSLLYSNVRDPTDRRIRDKGLKQFQIVTNLEMRAYKLNPAQMHLYSQEGTGAYNVMTAPAFNPEKRRTAGAPAAARSSLVKSFFKHGGAATAGNASSSRRQ